MRSYPALILLLLAALVSCAVLQDRHGRAQAIARDGSLVQGFLDTGRFRLTVFYRGLERHNSALAVYIEGDGHAWKQRHLLSDDPTPMDPISLKLAAQDPAPAVLYIARPCQYLAPDVLKGCDPKYWSSHRYGDEVIQAVSEAIAWGVGKSGASKVNLYGYSGGGTIAALVAARRADVNRLITIAANLDHALWSKMQRLSPLSGSLNPADETSKLQNIPQVHFTGRNDTIVPISILESYRARYGANKNINLEIMPGFDHHCCWVDAWPELLLTIERRLSP